MRAYLVRFLTRMYAIKGKEYIDNLLELNTITQEEYDSVVSE